MDLHVFPILNPPPPSLPILNPNGNMCELVHVSREEFGNWYTETLKVCTLDIAILLLGIIPKEIIGNKTQMCVKRCSSMCID